MPGSEVEKIKEDSRALRGTLKETCESDASHFSHEEYQLLKFHGSYQQDDRDQRNERKKAGQDKAWIFMIRTKTPGGSLSSKQYLEFDRIAGDLGNNTLRITTRQGIQFHGILKAGFKETIQRLNRVGVTTKGACGDVVRNTLAAAAPFQNAVYREVQRLAKELSDTFLSRSRSYTEIWLDGKKLNADVPNDSPTDEEPIYGKVYLPRKFKFAIAVPPYNDIDVFTNDVGFIAHAPNGQVEGYNVFVGGGLGMTHGMLKTHPMLAQPLFYVKKEHAPAAAVAIVTMQRDFGNREDRKISRLKHVVEDRGIEWVRQEVGSRLKAPTEPIKPFAFVSVADLLGWHEQGDGKLFCGIFVTEGRIQDAHDVHYRSAFRVIAEKFGFPMRFTANCNLYFHDIDPSKRKEVDEILKAHKVPHTDGFTESRKTAHACVALPTCGLALAESERIFPALMDSIDGVLRELKLEKEPILFRMTGCPNGCARPYNADFAFVGRAPNKYAFFVGGSIVGDRLAGLEKKMVELKDIPSVVRSYLKEFAEKRKNGETFSQYWGRTHVNGAKPVPEQFHIELAEREARLAGAKQPASVSE